MSDSPAQIIVGSAVLVVATGFLIFAGQATGFGSSRAGYELSASFRSAEGITVGSDVRLAGVKIGSVTKMALNTRTFFADTEITLFDGIQLPDDSAITIASEGLLGGNFVEVSPGGSLSNFEAGAEIEDTQGAVSLISLLMKFVSGSGAE
ncbi:outer membrane lipid asymmetry maintenance protein MlaD [Falsihalocynthiibacter sp. S25ZX9]|uniref:outer membrane lipid asymmetry maintenance protein MlaD n=1 Tax=Falsihalocynthiibacter sp. S25ZX9 TaxID=3240870 RepID=UPI00350FBBC5